jgi:hypothetical protein
MIRSTLPNSLEAGLMTHSRLLRISLLTMVVKPLARVSILQFPHFSLVFFEAELLSYLPKTLPA